MSDKRPESEVLEVLKKTKETIEESLKPLLGKPVNQTIQSVMDNIQNMISEHLETRKFDVGVTVLRQVDNRIEGYVTVSSQYFEGWTAGEIRSLNVIGVPAHVPDCAVFTIDPESNVGSMRFR
jgi:hypothetical protein